MPSHRVLGDDSLFFVCLLSRSLSCLKQALIADISRERIAAAAAGSSSRRAGGAQAESEAKSDIEVEAVEVLETLFDKGNWNVAFRKNF